MSLPQDITIFLNHLKSERGLSPHTVAAYSRDLTRYIDYLSGRGITEAEQIDVAAVAGFPIALHQQGMANSTVSRMTVAVRSLHRFWVEEGITKSDPAHEVTPLTPNRHLPKALTVEEIENLIEACAGNQPQVTADQLCDWALVELLYGTGGRITEVLSLDVDDAMRMLSDDSVGLKFLGKGNKQRIVPVGGFARKALDAYLVRGRPELARKAARATPALFLNSRGNRITRTLAYNRVAALGRKAGISAEVSPHTLRHSYATHLIDGGADVRVVQELLGHASVATTQIYTLVTVDHLREVYRFSHPRAVR
jgi:integrase/recombinase XerD